MWFYLSDLTFSFSSPGVPGRENPLVQHTACGKPSRCYMCLRLTLSCCYLPESDLFETHCFYVVSPTHSICCAPRSGLHCPDHTTRTLENWRLVTKAMSSCQVRRCFNHSVRFVVVTHFVIQR